MIMYESQPQEGICVCAMEVIRRDYELMNMYRFSPDKSWGAGALGIQFASFTAQTA